MIGRSLVRVSVDLVIVVVAIMTSPSGTAYIGGGGTKMSRRDEEFHQPLNPEGSISPS